MNYYYTIFGATYNCGAYGASTYQNNSCGTTTPTTGGTTGGASGGGTTGSSGTLTNTGFDIAVTITIASVILLAAVLVRYFKRAPKAKTHA